MRQKALFVAALALALVPAIAFAQTVVATDVPPDTVWWIKIANEAYAAVLSLVAVAVPIITGFLANFLWSKSKLAGIIFSQKMLDKLNAGIIAFIRAEAERLKQHLDPVSPRVEATASAAPATIELKRKIVENVQPKVEAAFKETLAHFDKKPGSQAVTDMIMGRVEQALKPDPAVVVPFPQNKG